MRTEEERKAYALARAREHYSVGKDAVSDEEIAGWTYYQWAMLMLASRHLGDVLAQAIYESRLMRLLVRLAERVAKR